MSELASLLPLVGIALLFWFLLIRPTQRRARDQRQMQSALSLGDEVMLTSGIFGVLTSVDEERLQVEVANGVRLSVARGAVGSVVTKAEHAGEPIGEDPAELSGQLSGELSGTAERSETVTAETASSETGSSQTGVTEPAETGEER